METRKGYNIPDSSSSRRSHFQNEERRKGFVFEKGRTYAADFGNGYLDFNGMFRYLLYEVGVVMGLDMRLTCDRIRDSDSRV